MGKSKAKQADRCGWCVGPGGRAEQRGAWQGCRTRLWPHRHPSASGAGKAQHAAPHMQLTPACPPGPWTGHRIPAARPVAPAVAGWRVAVPLGAPARSRSATSYARSTARWAAAPKLPAAPNKGWPQESGTRYPGRSRGAPAGRRACGNAGALAGQPQGAARGRPPPQPPAAADPTPSPRGPRAGDGGAGEDPGRRKIRAGGGPRAARRRRPGLQMGFGLAGARRMAASGPGRPCALRRRAPPCVAAFGGVGGPCPATGACAPPLRRLGKPWRCHELHTPCRRPAAAAATAAAASSARRLRRSIARTLHARAATWAGARAPAARRGRCCGAAPRGHLGAGPDGRRGARRALGRARVDQRRRRRRRHFDCRAPHGGAGLKPQVA
jgi:hypothetical protein